MSELDGDLGSKKRVSFKSILGDEEFKGRIEAKRTDGNSQHQGQVPAHADTSLYPLEPLPFLLFLRIPIRLRHNTALECPLSD